MQAQVVRCRAVRNGLVDFFPAAFVNSQIAQVDRLKILERMVFGSSPLLSGVFVTFFSFKLRTKKNSKSFRGEIMKKIPDIINRLWNVCGQMEVWSVIDLRIWDKVYLSQIRRSIMLDSHLTTYIPQAVNNGRYFVHCFRFFLK